MKKKNKPEPKSMKSLSPRDRKFVNKHMIHIMNAIHSPSEDTKKIMSYTQGLYSDIATFFQQGFLYSAKPKFHKDIFVTNSFSGISDKSEYNTELYCMITDNIDDLEFWAVQGYFSGLEYKGIRREE